MSFLAGLLVSAAVNGVVEYKDYRNVTDKSDAFDVTRRFVEASHSESLIVVDSSVPALWRQLTPVNRIQIVADTAIPAGLAVTGKGDAALGWLAGALIAHFARQYWQHHQLVLHAT